MFATYFETECMMFDTRKQNSRFEFSIDRIPVCEKENVFGKMNESCDWYDLVKTQCVLDKRNQ